METVKKLEERLSLENGTLTPTEFTALDKKNYSPKFPENRDVCVMDGQFIA